MISNYHIRRLVKVCFVWYVPKFVDLDLKERGGYEIGDVDIFDSRIADLLVKKKRAIKL